MKTIIEKLGIEELEVKYHWFAMVEYINEHEVRDLEQLKNEIVVSLIDHMIADKMNEGYDPTERDIKIVEKACYPLKWEEIKAFAESEE